MWQGLQKPLRRRRGIVDRPTMKLEGDANTPRLREVGDAIGIGADLLKIGFIGLVGPANAGSNADAGSTESRGGREHISKARPAVLAVMSNPVIGTIASGLQPRLARDRGYGARMLVITRRDMHIAAPLDRGQPGLPGGLDDFLRGELAEGDRDQTSPALGRRAHEARAAAKAWAARAWAEIFAQSLALIVSRGAIHDPPIAAMRGSCR